MASKRKRSKTREGNTCIKNEKYSNDVGLPITINGRMESISEKVEVDDINEDNTQDLSVLYHKTVQLTQSALIRHVLIDALESIPVLKKKCLLLGINGNFDYPQADELEKLKCPGEYKVEQILNHDTVNHLYFIKWKGYGTEYNTWEPIDHLGNVSHLVKNFRLMERSVSDDDKIAYKMLVLLSCLLSELTSAYNKDPYILLKLNGKEIGIEEYKSEHFFVLKNQFKVKSDFVQKILTKDGTFQLNYCRVLERAMSDLGVREAFQSVDNLNDAMTHRKKFIKCLKNWESNINRLILEQEGCATIEVENICDFDSPFEEFTYITKSIPGSDVYIEEPLLFCGCNDCGSNSATCCPRLNGSSFVYNEGGSLKSMKQMTIFECNSKCQCPPTCPNRVIQNGQKLAIFKTVDGRGWGVKALERIPKGKFIVEYVGEIITEREAESRTAFGQNPFHKSYLFDMESEHGTNCDYVLDAEKFGNISRFINHSCSPNMEVFTVWIGNPDTNMPRIAFFSRKCIDDGEELTFDYRMSAPVAPHKNGSDAVTFRVPCKCGSKKCRKYLF